MSKRAKRRRKKKPRRHIFLILIIASILIFLLYGQLDHEKIPPVIIDIFREITIPEKPPPSLPMVAIVIDDLGPNKERAEAVLSIDAPLTISIIPFETYSRWIAQRAHRLGRDIILHVPMEATRPLKLGRGGLYTWMTDSEIISTLREDIQSVPHIKGISNHMGSQFTSDTRAMEVVIKELKKKDLIFLDSVTTPSTVGYLLAKKYGLQTLRRDVFLDTNPDPAEIKKQWKRLLRIAKKRGYAIALAHPRRDTIEFLRKVIKNEEVKIVPLTQLIPPS